MMRAAVLLSLCLSAQAFVGQRGASYKPTSALRSTPENTVEALRAAAAKAREEVQKMEQELGRKKAAVADDDLPAKKLPEQVKALIPTILAETDVTKQYAQWQELKKSRSVTAFGSADLRTFPVSLSVLEQRSGMTAEKLGLVGNDVSLDDFKYATLYVAGFSTLAGVGSLAFLPPNIGAAFCYMFALLPIVFLGIGSTSPMLIASAIATLRGDSDSVDASERVCRHEAAHFCCGYWCGLPVSQYSVQDGVARVEFDVASSTYSNTEVAALAITALGGLVAEAMKWGNAVGADQDLRTLETVLMRSAVGASAHQDITRWGALSASLLLRQNEQKYEKVVEAFQRQASIDDCIAILES